MKAALILVILGIGPAGWLANQDEPGEPKERPRSGGAMVDASPMPAKPHERTRAELEEEFKNTLTGATLVGTWQMTSSGEAGGKGELSPPRTDRYTIERATKLTDEIWVITARIQFADQDVRIPVPVRIVWAEDTPMITLSDFPVPMLGTYSCRVIFHHGYYSGIWYSTTKKYGGVMSGQIVKDVEKPQDQPPPKQP
jgi:hypothetical protein